MPNHAIGSRARKKRRTPAEIRAEYRAMAPGYDDGSRAGGWQGPAEIAAALSGHMAPGMHVIDAGTGTGEVMQRLRAAPLEKPLHITGLDLSPDMLKICGEKGVADALHAQDLARPWPVARASQDMVTSSGVLEYLDDGQAQALIRNAARALKPNGKIALTFLPHREDAPATHQKTHAVERIKELFRENGIEPKIARVFDAYRGSSGVVEHVLILGIKSPEASAAAKPKAGRRFSGP